MDTVVVNKVWSTFVCLSMLLTITYILHGSSSVAWNYLQVSACVSFSFVSMSTSFIKEVIKEMLCIFAFDYYHDCFFSNKFMKEVFLFPYDFYHDNEFIKGILLWGNSIL